MMISAAHGSDGFLAVVWYGAQCDRCGQDVTDVNSTLFIDTDAGTVVARCKNAMICSAEPE
jgi:hypothetical protein